MVNTYYTFIILYVIYCVMCFTDVFFLWRTIAF